MTTATGMAPAIGKQLTWANGMQVVVAARIARRPPPGPVLDAGRLMRADRVQTAARAIRHTHTRSKRPGSNNAPVQARRQEALRAWQR